MINISENTNSGNFTVLEIAEIKHSKIFQPHTENDTLIFCQYDPGKTPYNSWGKPVRKLFFISKYCFYGEMICTVKIPAIIIFTYLEHCACTPPRFSCQMQNRKLQRRVQP